MQTIMNIRTFLTIVELKSLSRAAEALFVSQSTVSARLSSLEEQLNTRLIIRNPGKQEIQLTEKGEEFIVLAKLWLALEKDTDLWINNDSQLNLNVGSIDSLNIFVFPPLFKEIITLKIPLTINLSSHSSIELFNHVESYELDIGFTSRVIKNNYILSEPLFSEGMVLISSSLYSNYEDLIHPKDLDATKEIFLDWGPNYLIWHDIWWDPKLPVEIRVDTAGLISNFIDIPDSWAIVPISVAKNLESKHPIKTSLLSSPPDNRIYYKIKHRSPRPSSIKSLKIFEEMLSDFISSSEYMGKV